MDSLLYDVYLTGKLADGLGREAAAERLARIFKAAPATMLGLLTGKPQLLKRGVDKATALKYREALQPAGVEVAFKPQPTHAPAVAAQTAAAARPSAPQPAATEAGPAAAAAVAPVADTGTGALTLAPAGSDVLSAAERSHVAPAVIDLGHLSLAEPGATLGEESHQADAPSLPEIDGWTLREAGGDLLAEDERTHLPSAAPDIPDFTLAPAGAELETLHDERPPVQVDTAALSLAPAGTDLLPPEQRRKTDAVAPATDHLKLAP